MTKYHAKCTTVDGITFASQKEAKRYQELKLLERAGFITGLELQPKFEFIVHGKPVLIRSKGYPNGRKATYKADFRYFCLKRNAKIIEDVKSSATRTEADVLRRALVEAIYGIKVEEV